MTIYEGEETPEWALDKAAKAAGWNSWQQAKNAVITTEEGIASVRAHAATIVKYEKPQVNKVEVKAKDLLNANGIWPCDLSDESYNCAKRAVM
ncbi:MAG: hypothetical protein ABJ330_08010, partial [Parasphingorhabdus sp.]